MIIPAIYLYFYTMKLRATHCDNQSNTHSNFINASFQKS